MSLTWGLCIGTASPIPYFYSVFFIAVLTHRVGRDFERYAHLSREWYVAHAFELLRCAAKYGEDWQRYCSIVKYKFIPGIY